ncbi:MAG: hypothetical protein HF974_11075 [ANME-2 cluster archaeon]|nr:hypothetical protein [ANME-2 cluster archaeon]
MRHFTLDFTLGLISFMENKKIQSGIVITKDKTDVWEVNGMEILLIPAWLVLCGL